jgi:prepilin-type N-terminal cleavage/methylation domain-containing protein
MEDRNEKGFTLIELLIAIVVVGILTAVAIVGIAGLTNNGKTSACQASLDAAKAATAVHYANNNGTYPTGLGQLTAGTNPEWEAPTGILPTVVAAGPPQVTAITTNGWTLTMTQGATTSNAPTFVCT